MNTIFLATVIGWYFVIFAMLIFVRHNELKASVLDVMAQRGLFLVLAIITLILGLIMVVSHNIWVMGWPVIITVISWLILISGLSRLFLPEHSQKMMKPMLNSAYGMYIFALVLLILGLFLLFKSYYVQAMVLKF